MNATIEINLALVLPTMGEADRCVERITEWLSGRKGITKAHIVRENGNAELCVHYDPHVIPLAQVRRLAQHAGAVVSARYRHEQIAFAGLDAADSAAVLAAEIERLPGVLHAELNYAAGFAMVAYDTTIIQRPAIVQAMRSMGARPVATTAFGTQHPATAAQETEAAGHDHGSAPTFLPHWIQERWTLILVVLAGIFLLIGWSGETFFALPPQFTLVFYLLAYLAGGYDIATHAIPALVRGKFDTDVLMLAAAVGAGVLGEWQEGAFLLFLFALGHAGEHFALNRARNAVGALGQLMPQSAQVRRGEQIVELAVAQVQVGDVVVVRPGDRMPVDGTIATGTGAVDQSPITGESVPVTKQPGDDVFAGTINLDAAFDVRVTRLAADNTLSRVMQLVAEAQGQQSPTQQLTQRFTRWFVPAVLISAVLVTIVPPLFGWMSLTDSFYRAMLLLVAASPCALALGTPAAVLAGIAQAARNGVLIKGGVHLENLGGLSAIAFDKTGTLTEGRFAVTDNVPVGSIHATDVLRTAAAVEVQSNHPLARAVVRAAHEQGLDLPVAEGLENVPGRGVRSRIGGQPVLIGSLKLFAETSRHGVDPIVAQEVERLEQAGRSTMVISQGGRFLGVLGLADTPRVGTRGVMDQLRSLGLQHLVMLTGDNAAVAQRVAQEVGVTDVRAELLPEDKLAAIKALGAQYGGIAMIGDGVNDAPALATATVGIAMGGAGTAVALETADVALMADDLHKLPFAIGLSRASRAIIQQNLGISLGVIALLLITSVLGLVQLSWAVVLHEGSTLVVVINALRLLSYDRKA